MNYVYQYDIAACFLIGVLIILMMLRRGYPTTANKIYIAMLFSNLVAAVLDLLTVFIISTPTALPMWLNYLVNMLYFATFNGCAILYFAYVIIIIKDRKASKFEQWAFVAVIAIDLAIIGSTPLTGWAFRFDEAGVYHRGDLMLFLYVSSAFLLLYTMILSIVHRQTLNKFQRSSIVIFIISLVFAISIQMIFEELLLQSFACGLYLVTVYVSLQNPDDHMDKSTHCYNQAAFFITLEKFIAKKKQFSVVAFTTDDFQYINRILGVKGANELIDTISEYLMAEFGAKNVYHLRGCRYVIVINERTGDCEGVAQRIRTHFAKPCVLRGSEVRLTPMLCRLDYPDFAETAEDINDAIEFTLKSKSNTNGEELIRVSNDALNKKNRENQVIECMKRAIQSNSFMVYYQPIYSTSTQRFSSAEALIRLIDKELGFIPPDEFIPIAERNGLITQIGEIVFRKVCSFLHRYNAEELGINCIEVNLSTVQCMNEELPQKMLSAMKEYNVLPTRINFEITETAHSEDDKILLNMMQTLIDEGCTFSMDDYGTGFSTTNYLTRLPFSMVKIDKSILWPAMKDEDSMTILKHTVNMLQRLRKSIVVEGVEDEKMAQLLIDMNVDFLQGYHYSRPIPEADYVVFLKKHLR